MEKKKPLYWITLKNGKHIPIYEEQNKQRVLSDEQQKQAQIKANQIIASRLNGETIESSTYQSSGRFRDEYDEEREHDQVRDEYEEKVKHPATPRISVSDKQIEQFQNGLHKAKNVKDLNDLEAKVREMYKQSDNQQLAILLSEIRSMIRNYS